MKKYLFTILLLLSALLSNAQWAPGGIQLAPSSHSDFNPDIAMSSNNSSWVVWRGEDTVSGKGTIYLTGFDKQGDPLSGFGSGAMAICGNGDYYAPKVVMSDDSDLIVTWYGYADTTSSYSGIYIQKFTEAGTPLWNGGTAVLVSATDSTHNNYPEIAPDKNGGAYICWAQYDNNIDFSSADIVLQRIDNSGHVAAGWAGAPDAVAATPNIPETYPKIAVTPAGDGIYVQYYKGFIDSLSLLLTRVNASDGSIATGFTNGSGVVLSVGPYLNPLLLIDNFVFCDTSGNALSVWCESRVSANGEIYYQRTLANGAKTLALNGKVIAGNSNQGYGYLYATLDDDGSILATWNDYVNNYDVGGAKFSLTGTIVWLHSTPLTNDQNSAYPKILPDHHGGSYIFYNEIANYPYAINCLRLNSGGNLLWSLPGLHIGLNYIEDGFDPQLGFSVANVDSVQASVVWEYSTTDFYNVYACDVLPSEQSCFEAPTAVQSFNSLDGIKVYPNPSKDQFTISNFGESVSSQMHLELYNEMGMVVGHYSWKGSADINTSEFAAGIYFGKVLDKQGNYFFSKIIIER